MEPVLPGGGVRIRSYNREEYPDENYTNTEKDVAIGTLRNIYRQAGWDW
jgi:phage repressor protein C with HTH and peptisase S24 domain